MRGRFAPSPTGPLHLGNLRTALTAWLMARHAGAEFVVRMEDLDPVTSSAVHETGQLASLRSLGIDWDGEVVRQSERFELYCDALARLRAEELTYDCYCTRREIRLAALAPHGGEGDGAYPGTCRLLSERVRQAHAAAGRKPAQRLRGDGGVESFTDSFAGVWAGPVDDVVLQRNDGVPAYNLAVVIDDAAQGVTEVVRGDDLLAATPSQIRLQRLLGLPTPCYAHVPMVLAPDGTRLAKRHGAVTLADLEAGGVSAAEVCSRLAVSLGIVTGGRPVQAADLLDRFQPDQVPRTPWHLTPAEL